MTAVRGAQGSQGSQGQVGAQGSQGVQGTAGIPSSNHAVTMGKAGALPITGTDIADFPVPSPWTMTLATMECTCQLGPSGGMSVQLRKSTDNGVTWSDVTGFLCSFAGSGAKTAAASGTAAIAAGTLLGFSITGLGGGQNLLVEVATVDGGSGPQGPQGAPGGAGPLGDGNIFDIVNDGGADPLSLGKDATAAILAGIAAGRDIYIPPGTDWAYDPSAGPIAPTQVGQVIFGMSAGGSRVYAVDQPDGSIYPGDLIQLSQDYQQVRYLTAGRLNDKLAALSAPLAGDPVAQRSIMNPAGSTFTVLASPTTGFPPTGCASVDNDSTGNASLGWMPCARFTYTSKDALGFYGCVWELPPPYAGSWNAGIHVAETPTYGAVIRVVNDASQNRFENVRVNAYRDGLAFGDDTNWHETKAQYTGVDGVTHNLRFAPASGFPAFPSSILHKYVAIWGLGTKTWSQFGKLGDLDPGVYVSAVAGDGSWIELSQGQDSLGNQYTLATNWLPNYGGGGVDNPITTAFVNTALINTPQKMVWGGSALTQGGLGSGYGTFIFGFRMDNIARHSLHVTPNFDHADLGDYHFHGIRVLPAQRGGETAWKHNGSGTHGAGFKSNGANYGIDLSNLLPEGPGGNQTTNFDFGDWGLESASLAGVRLGHEAVCIFASVEVGSMKINIDKQMTEAMILVDDCMEGVHFGMIRTNVSGGGRPAAACVWVRGMSTDVSWDKATLRGPSHLSDMMVGSKASRVKAGRLVTAGQTQTFWHMRSDDGVNFAPLDTTAESYNRNPWPVAQAEVLDRIPGFYLDPQNGGLAASTLAKAFRVAIMGQDAVELDVLYSFSILGVPWTRRDKVIAYGDGTDGHAPTIQATTDSVFPASGFTAPAIAYNPMTDTTYTNAGFLQITVQNNDSVNRLCGSIEARIRGRYSGVEVNRKAPTSASGINANMGGS